MASFCVTLFDTIENPIDNDACFSTATKNLTLNKGSSYKIIYSLYKDGSDVDLTGYSLRGVIKPSSTSPDVMLNLSTANLLLEINNSNSTISMNLRESFTRRVTVASAVYDIEIINNLGDATKIITGLINFI
jgi:hypothetical protein